MAKTVTASAERGTAASYAGLEPEQLIRMYRLMYLSRRTDDREILLKRQQKIFSRSPAPAMRHCWWPQAWR